MPRPAAKPRPTATGASGAGAGAAVPARPAKAVHRVTRMKLRAWCPKWPPIAVAEDGEAEEEEGDEQPGFARGEQGLNGERRPRRRGRRGGRHQRGNGPEDGLVR